MQMLKHDICFRNGWFAIRQNHGNRGSLIEEKCENWLKRRIESVHFPETRRITLKNKPQTNNELNKK